MRIFIVDDSITFRKQVKSIIENNSDSKVIGEAENGVDLLRKIEGKEVDLILLDLVMPKMDGITVLKKIMKRKPTKVIIITSFNKTMNNLVLKALELGAITFIEKNTNLKEFEIQIIELIRQVETKKPGKSKIQQNIEFNPQKFNIRNSLVVIGSSTGGIKAIRTIVGSLKKPFPPIIIVQHLPLLFTESFAERLNKITDIEVFEAKHNDIIEPNKIYVAKSGNHLVLKEENNQKLIQLIEGDRVNGVIPSIDVTALSASYFYDKHLVLVILTGMGHDGLSGARYSRENGGTIISQDEASSAIYGMPRTVNEENLSHYIGNPAQIIAFLKKTFVIE